MKRAVVVFRDSDRKGILRFLKPGFRHCFILLPVSSSWLVLESTFVRLHCDVITQREVDHLTGWYKQQGMTVIDYPLEKGMSHLMPPGVFSCVELVKRILGLRVWWVQTPWRLFQYLKNENKLGKYS